MSTEQLGLVLTSLTILSLVGGWWVKRGRPSVRKARGEATAMRDAILGREVVVDSITGKELAPPLPGIGVRMAHQETQMALLTDAVSKIADSHRRLQKMDDRLDEHDRDIGELKAAQMERIITRAESAQAWSAVEAVAKSNGDEPNGPHNP